MARIAKRGLLVDQEPRVLVVVNAMARQTRQIRVLVRVTLEHVQRVRVRMARGAQRRHGVGSHMLGIRYRVFFRFFEVSGINMRVTACARDHAIGADVVCCPRHRRQIRFVTFQTRLRIDRLGFVGASNAQPCQRSKYGRAREEDYDKHRRRGMSHQVCGYPQYTDDVAFLHWEIDVLASISLLSA